MVAPNSPEGARGLTTSVRLRLRRLSSSTAGPDLRSSSVPRSEHSLIPSTSADLPFILLPFSVFLAATLMLLSGLVHQSGDGSGAVMTECGPQDCCSLLF